MLFILLDCEDETLEKPELHLSTFRRSKLLCSLTDIHQTCVKVAWAQVVKDGWCECGSVVLYMGLTGEQSIV